MRKLLLIPALGMLAFLAACGGSGNAGFGSSTVGNFSAASISGNYTYQIYGWDLGVQATTATPFREAGVFTADGKGNITAGEDDYAEGTTVVTHTITSGTYTVANDGTGDATLNFNNGGGIHVDLTVASSSLVYVITDAIGPFSSTALFANGYGTVELQTASAFSAAPSGTFVFRKHTVTAGQTNSTSTVGVFTVSSGTVSAGTEDVNQNGAITQLNLTAGNFTTPDSQGRGTGTLTDSNATTTTFDYYVVNASSIRLFSTDTGNTGLGRAEAQSTSSFSNASLSGGYAFGADGDDSTTGLDGLKTVGRFNGDGGGNLTAGALDTNADGTPASNVSFTGMYNIASNGRGTASETSSTVPLIFYLVSPSRGFFLVNDATVVEDGTFDAQTGTFSNSSMNGQYAFNMDGFDTSGNLWDWIGWLRGDGSGNLSSSEVLNPDGSPSTTGIVSGSYSVMSNGRATGSINNGIFSNASTGLVFYLVSSSSGYVLEPDTGFQVSGFMTKQQTP